MKKSIKRLIVRSPLFIRIAILLTKKINPRILVYHRFCDASDPSAHKVDGETFEWQLNQIKKYFTVITLGEYLKLREKGNTIPSNLVIITVDDGYYDFYKLAYPVLKKFNVGATFFCTVNFLDKKEWLWPDRISYALEKTEKKKFTMEFSGKTWRIQL